MCELVWNAVFGLFLENFDPLFGDGVKSLRGGILSRNYQIKFRSLPESGHFCLNRKHILLNGTPRPSKNVKEVQFSWALQESRQSSQFGSGKGGTDSCFVFRGQVWWAFKQSGIEKLLPIKPKIITTERLNFILLKWICNLKKIWSFVFLLMQVNIWGWNVFWPLRDLDATPL